MAYLYSSIDQLYSICGRFGGMSKQIVRNESSCLYTGAFTTKSRSQSQHIYTKQHKFPLHHLRCAAAQPPSLPSGNMSAQNKDFSVCRMEVINMRSASTKRKIRISLTVFTNRVKPQRFHCQNMPELRSRKGKIDSSERYGKVCQSQAKEITPAARDPKQCRGGGRMCQIPATVDMEQYTTNQVGHHRSCSSRNLSWHGKQRYVYSAGPPTRTSYQDI